MKSTVISVISNRKHVTIPAYDILYIHLEARKSVIHIAGGKTYETYTTIDELSEMLGESFIRVDRATLVSTKAIHDIGKKIELINGETLDFTHRRKRELKQQLHIGRRHIIKKLSDSDAPNTRKEYQRHYASFDGVPFAFTDIEMVFNEEQSAVDWIFRYGNEALARLENIPLEKLIDNSFGNIFPNMDSKWLRVYKRTALFGEKIELSDFSPEIDKYLKIISFPTFRGHCGCILFDCDEIQTLSGNAENTEV